MGIAGGLSADVVVVVVGLFKCSLVVEATASTTAAAASISKVEADAVEGAAFLEDAFLSIANRISSPKSK